MDAIDYYWFLAIGVVLVLAGTIPWLWVRGARRRR